MKKIATLLFAIALSTGFVFADGTETLGPLSIMTSSGTDIVGVGTGLFTQPGNVDLVVPAGATVEQVLLYWNGFHSTIANGDDTITLNGVPIKGTRIGGPTFFFTENFSSTYRADITGLGAIVPGTNMLSVAGADFDSVNNGASVVVIIDDGSPEKDLQFLDGQDLAFLNFMSPLDTTLEQTFVFAGSAFERTANLTLLAASVQGPASGVALIRPNRLRVTVDGQAPYDVLNPFASSSGFEWDHVELDVVVPPGAAFITVQALSENDATMERPSSFCWIATAMELSEPFCGDGNQDPGEWCDDGNTDNGDSCRNDCWIPICGDFVTDPQNGESCDPPGDPAGASGNTCRQDCTVCGDGFVDPTEECDDGNTTNSDACRNDCTIPVCGDMIVDPQNGETCDPPGYDAGANGNSCRIDCTVCGDGVMDPTEECDDGNMTDGDTCRNDCTIPVCGDMIVDPQNGETCDPPGQSITSGNLIQDGSFEAGTPNPFWTEFSTNFGTTLCSPASCGFDLAADGDWWSWFGGASAAEEGIVSQPVALPDGASASLQFALWLITCSGEASDFFEVSVNGDVVFSVDLTDSRCSAGSYSLETVDLGAYAGQSVTLEFRAVTGTTGGAGNIFVDLVSLEVYENTVCRDDCTFCGDGIPDVQEECDDGNMNDNDACRNDCTIPVCGDIIVDPQNGETCDPPGYAAGAIGNSCRVDCTVCGDGVLDFGEECDDGNSVNNDDCNNECIARPLLADLASFTAEITDAGVVLRWETVSEIDNVGFHVLRATTPEGGAREKAVEVALHDGLIPAGGTEISGARYQFTDNSTLEPGTYRYILEDVDLFGVVTRHPSVEITIEAPQRYREVGRRR